MKKIDELKAIAFFIDIPKEAVALLPSFYKKKEEILQSGDLNQIKEFLAYATDEEVLCVLMSESLKYPLNEEAVRIMTYLLTSVLKDKIPEDLRFEGKLTEWEQMILMDLRVKTRKKVVERIKEHLKNLGGMKDDSKCDSHKTNRQLSFL